MVPEAQESVLRARFGEAHFERRMRAQRTYALPGDWTRRRLLPTDKVAVMRALVSGVLRMLGLYERGRRNALTIQAEEHHADLPTLPQEFDGFRVLQLSDLHLDLESPAMANAIAARLRDLSYDLCVITGDFQSDVHRGTEAALCETERLLQHVNAPTYAILGNHDQLEMATRLEALGIRVLLNENTAVQRGHSTLYLAGIDDPHYHGASDLDRALEGIPAEGTTILLSHSAEPHAEAALRGVDLMLTGHTHGGQLCLPNGRSIYHNSTQPRAMSRGRWRQGRLLGYTSRGAGSATVPVRFFCPPEITVHVLKRV